MSNATTAQTTASSELTATHTATKRVFISSTGRTATQFFAKHLHTMIDHSVSLHEPGTPWPSKPKQLMGQIKDYGFYHLTLGQNKNTHSMYKLSRDYIAGVVDRDQAKQNILSINQKVDALNPADVVIYSSGHIYGLLGLIDELYEDARFVFVIRDPRDWIGSALNKMEYSLYGPIELLFRELSLQPVCFENDPYRARWQYLSKFEKYCWFYNKLNELVLEEMKDKPNFKVFRYEDVFLSDQKEEHFSALLDFAVSFEDGKIECECDTSLIGQKVDSKQSKAKHWAKWSPEQAKIMDKHCGKLMAEYGYGTEDIWSRKLEG